jgi:hypothetical protein
VGEGPSIGMGLKTAPLLPPVARLLIPMYSALNSSITNLIVVSRIGNFFLLLFCLLFFKMQIRLKWLGSGIQQPDDDSHVDVDRSVENRDGILGHHLTKESSFLLHAIHSPFYTVGYWRILR